MNNLLPCPFCGGEATIDNAGGKYQAWCKHCCCIHMGEFYNTEAEAIAAWNRRAQPENEPRGLLTAWETPESCPNCMEHLSLDWVCCPECGRPTDWAKNEPLTLDELRKMDGEPVWTVTNGVEGSGRWEILESADNEFMRLCNPVDTTYDCPIDTYGKTWLAYRRKPERSEG